MNSQIRISRDGQQYGPYSLEELATHLQNGVIFPDDLAWKEGIEGWKPLREVIDLCSLSDEKSKPVLAPIQTPQAAIISNAPLHSSGSSNEASNQSSRDGIKFRVTLDELKRIVTSLGVLFARNEYPTITKKRYENFCADGAIGLEALTGWLEPGTWKGFKERIVGHLVPWGFVWKVVPGFAGPLSLEQVTLPSEVGRELAKRNFSENEGDFLYLIRREFEPIFSVLAENNVFDYVNVRDGFTNYKKDGKSYRFRRGRGGTSFYKSVAGFRYQHNEVTLGEKLLPKLKEKLKIEIEHTQVSRAGGKYQNIDFVGYKIENDFATDRLVIYAFELKRSNRIADISEAISQASNYKAVSNYSYVIIPRFDEELVPDESRFQTFVQLCKSNGVGILTILFDDRGEPASVYEVCPAVYGEVLEKSTLVNFTKERGYEVCPLCKRIVTKKDRKGCDWLVEVGEQEKCMKILMEMSFGAPGSGS